MKLLAMSHQEREATLIAARSSSSTEHGLNSLFLLSLFPKVVVGFGVGMGISVGGRAAVITVASAKGRVRRVEVASGESQCFAPE